MIDYNQVVNVSLHSILNKRVYYEKQGFNVDNLKLKVNELTCRTYTNKDYSNVSIEMPLCKVFPSASSQIKVKVVCDYCHTEYETMYMIVLSRSGKNCCKNCIHAKSAESLKKEFGVTNVSQLDSIKLKKKELSLQKFGTITPLQNKEIKEKIVKTNIEKYGVKYASMLKEKVDYTKEAWKNKTEEELSDIRYRRDKTWLLNRGFLEETLAQAEKDKVSFTEIKRNFNRKVSYSTLSNFAISQNFSILTSFEEFKSFIYEKGKTIRFKCNTCDTEFFQYMNYGFVSDDSRIECPKCPSAIGSREENEVLDYIKSIYFNEIIHSYKLINRKEIDIVIPEFNLGIEYNGSYWHNDKFRGKYYHIEKYNSAKEEKIDLIFINDFEWKYKQDIVKSIIKNRLKIVDKRLYARKGIISLVDSSTAKEFFYVNHIQGSKSINSKMISIGLYIDSELVSLVSFNKTKYRKDYEYDLVRYANKLGYQVIGGFSKILSFFEKAYKPSSIVTFSEIRLFKSSVYEKAGFTLDHITRPNYFYTKNNIFAGSRQNFQKSKLKKLFDDYTDSKTESEMMAEHNYDKIWDCGVRVFVKKYQK